ncbi:HEPN domain-containing protein [Micromonospora tarensis]|uniref:RiboL-PSP-HEPN domain-containing protein n=1 Tax=Micromonospora tarensis TaxID=2806100 RepID=A0ABS1YDX3_9ACTN|nr:HEPN domain-containing protein [Micromonospora tarensis]MBM0275617.1 hypothetical protein [Micromonospora tarensis]
MTWPPLEVRNLERKLDELIALTDDRRDVTDEIRAWLARLLVVRSCGYLEQTVVETLRAYVREKSYGMVRAFAHSYLERSKNPSLANMDDQLGRLDAGLQADFREFLEADDQRLARELSFLVDRRHKIAHGLNEGITPVRALRLAASSKEVADWLILRLNPFP